MTRAVITRWYDEEGWGVADAREAPGGIFIHFSFIDADGYRSFRDGEEVELDLDDLVPTKSRGWRKGRLQFRASRIGRCAGSTSRAYTRLQVRVADLRGSAFGARQLWNGRLNLCHP